ncbi:hypothetical protein ABEB36_014364 [Hypothenemus hampei]|uniref:Craniofacial development protein 1 n=1 Tax=Hypothenemus hampei TaxID=57062 RepID=A0ABD1E8R7_HYPHA
MNKDDYKDESDTSDEDYVPDIKIEDAVSEVESDGDSEDPISGSEEDPNAKFGKRSKPVKTPGKKRKLCTVQETSKTLETKVECDPKDSEEQKKKADDLWADFMKDTGFRSKNTACKSSSVQSKTSQSMSKNDNKNEALNKIDSNSNKKIKVTQLFEFAGEEVRVEKEVDASSAEARLLTKSTPKSSTKKSGNLSGIGNVLTQLGKKQKISTLEKSKLDWDRFKKEENIEEELQTHNKGRDGYLDRQDFLQRADLRRFEIEKEIRNVERAKRFNSTL